MEDTRNYFHPQCYKVGIKEPKKIVLGLYLSGMSTPEISDYFSTQYNISVTPRTLTRYVVEAGMVRNPKDRKLNSISRGRMVYYKKPEGQKARRTATSQKTRMQALQRDNYRCQLCGDDGKRSYRLEAHHINFDSTDHALENLQTLCEDCHKGLHYLRQSS